MSDIRLDGRRHDQTRPVSIRASFMPNAEGSALIEIGNTHVICTATVEPSVPSWLRGGGRGWVTAEYGMLPRSTEQRVDRRRSASSGRSREIQRLIGRSLRAVTDLESLGERSIIIDCDVLRADGGTRTAAITGGYVALELALRKMHRSSPFQAWPLREMVSAVSVGVFGDGCLLDLSYEEDSRAQVDMNVVLTGGGSFVEVQGTAEESPFSDDQLQDMLRLARIGCQEMNLAQRAALSDDSQH